jgi:hypothetical protein
MEYWIIGVLEKNGTQTLLYLSITPILQYSNTPVSPTMYRTRFCIPNE